MRLRKLWKSMRQDNWLYNYSPPFGDYNYRHYFLHPWEYPEDVFQKLKWFYQRGKRGYSDRDVWSLDWHLSEYMGNALRDLAQQVHGTPILDTGRALDPHDPNDCDTFTLEEWKATILYIAETFDLAHKIEDYEIPVEQIPATMKRFQHGMAMFSEYFFALWD